MSDENPKPMSDEEVARITALAKKCQREVDGEAVPARPKPKLIYQPRVPPPPPATENHAPGGNYDSWRDGEDWRECTQGDTE